MNADAENLPNKDIVAEAERLDIKDRGVSVLVELLLNENVLTQIKQYRLLFLRFLANNQKAQKHLMGAFELLVGEQYPETLIPKSAHILKAFYDNDLVEEEVLIEWGAKVLLSLQVCDIWFRIFRLRYAILYFCYCTFEISSIL